MAIPPTIPTSFVPHPSTERRRFSSGFTDVFSFFAYVVLGIVFLLALGVFFYGHILAANKSSGDRAILAAEKTIDLKTIDDLVRLRDRLVSSEMLLDKHIVFSNFFASLEKILPSTVRFTALNLSIDAEGASKVDGAGTAKNFNALAAASMAFASEGSIKDAIFSKISVNKDNSVTFKLTATLDPKIIYISP